VMVVVEDEDEEEDQDAEAVEKRGDSGQLTRGERVKGAVPGRRHRPKKRTDGRLHLVEARVRRLTLRVKPLCQGRERGRRVVSASGAALRSPAHVVRNIPRIRRGKCFRCTPNSGRYPNS